MLVPVLGEARRRGFLGPGPIEAHLDHAAGFVHAVEAVGVAPRRAADLGSGGGVPGLPLALRFANCGWLLVESSVRRAAFLRDVLGRLGVGDRVQVAEDRAEAVGRTADRRGRFDLAVARGFGPPAVVAECGAPLLRVGGVAVVSEPPERPDRWPDDGLDLLGMRRGAQVEAAGATYQVLVQVRSCPDRYPRRVGVPGKRPLF